MPLASACFPHKHTSSRRSASSESSTARALSIKRTSERLSDRPAALSKHQALPRRPRLEAARAVHRTHQNKTRGSPSDAMAPPGRGDWRTGGFDLAATQPASPDEKTSGKDAPKAASKLREPRLHMRGLLAKRGSALLDPQRRKPTSDARLVFRSAEDVQQEEGKPAPFDTRSLTHAMTRDPASNTWRTVGGGAKDPGVREQAGSLLRAFEVAMDAVEKASINEAAAPDEPDGQKLAANILGEMIAAKHDVAQAFSKRTSLEASLDQEGKLNWTKEQKDISRLWCEAKWTDVLSQKLADLLQEQTREHGALLHKLRLKRAAMLDKALRLHSDALWRHDRACALMEKKGDALVEASRKHDALVGEKNVEIAALKERIADLERNRDADRALFELSLIHISEPTRPY